MGIRGVSGSEKRGLIIAKLKSVQPKIKVSKATRNENHIFIVNNEKRLDWGFSCYDAKYYINK